MSTIRPRRDENPSLCTLHLHYYVLDDRSLHASPHGWATAAVDAYRQHKADRLVAEVNFGGDMVESTIRTVDHNVSFRKVSASRAKQIRAEPIAALYEQGHVHHVGGFPALEDQMCGWVPGGDGPSPDRLDALVWAITDLMEGSSTSRFFASLAPDCPSCGTPNHYREFVCKSCGRKLRDRPPAIPLDPSLGVVGPRSDYVDDE